MRTFGSSFPRSGTTSRHGAATGQDIDRADFASHQALPHAAGNAALTGVLP
ncbi:hypothetical protein ABZ897_23480 [Nonomuraea sp. NPDC046802]|uniref:hypothetical protein n=1 Tax=Nonomuraea sp. NPDC046802 TaxID=3154919 RepID=UPI0034009BBD